LSTVIPAEVFKKSIATDNPIAQQGRPDYKIGPAFLVATGCCSSSSLYNAPNSRIQTGRLAV
jgi:hypothetical protein